MDLARFTRRHIAYDCGEMPESLMRMQFSWAHVIVAVLAIGLALTLSRLALGRPYRRRVLIIVVALAVSLLLHVLKMGIDVVVREGAPSALSGGAVLLLAFGITGLLGLLVFDLGFRRARLEVPTILRDIAQAIVFF